MKSRAKFKIGVDIDGVIADQVTGVLPLINKKLGTTYSFKDWNSYDWMTDTTGLSTAGVLQFMEVSWDQETIPPMEENITETLAEIRNMGSLIIISKRTFKSHAKVVETLQRWGIKYDAICLLEGSEEKQDYPLDVLIDDYPKEGYSDMPLIVIDQPWNQEIKTDWHTSRVNTVADSIPILNMLKKEMHCGS